MIKASFYALAISLLCHLIANSGSKDTQRVIMYNTSNILTIKKAHSDRKCDQIAEKACEFSYFLRFMLGQPSMVSQFYNENTAYLGYSLE